MKTVRETDMTIKQLADLIQKQIDIRLSTFMEYYDTLKAINKQIEELETKMTEIVVELEPVQSLIYTQNPKLEKIFESLKRIYGKEEHGTNREIS